MVRIPSDAVSPERQRDVCLAEAARLGYEAEFYSDAEGHRSGRTEKGRPGWLALKRRLSDPDVKAVIVESLSRASRSVSDLINLVEELDARNIRFISVKENIDTSSALGRLFVYFIGIMNQFESDIASERMAMTLTYKRAVKGQHIGPTPFGCKRDTSNNGVLLPTPEGIWRMGIHIVVGTRDNPPFVEGTTPAIWRGYHDALWRCYEWYAQGNQSSLTLCRRLNAEGYCYRDRCGKPRRFTEDDVRRLLAAHRLYAGYVLTGRAKDKASALREANFAPLLPRDLCDQVAAILESRRGLAGRLLSSRHKGRLYLLGGLLYCGACGQKMGGYFQDGKAFYRHQRAKRCEGRGQVPTQVIDDQVLEYLRRFTIPEDLKEYIIATANRMLQEQARPEWQAIRIMIDKLERKLETLKEMRIEGEIGKEEYMQRKAEVEAELHHVQLQLQDAPVVVRIEDLLLQIDRIADVFCEGSDCNKKELFQTLFERIEQVDGKITRVVVREWARPFFD